MKTFFTLLTLLPFIISCSNNPGTLQAGVLAMAQTYDSDFSGYTEEKSFSEGREDISFFDAPKADSLLVINSHTRQIFQDKKGHFWYATYGNGVYRYDGNRLTHFSTADGLSGNIVRGLAEDEGGNIWFATNGGVTRYTPQNSKSSALPAGKPGFTKFTTTDGLNHNGVWSLLFDKSGNLWAGTENGVSRYNPSALNITNKKIFTDFPLPASTLNTHADVYPAPKLISAIIQDKTGAIWFGTNGNGIYRFANSSAAELKRGPELVSNEKGIVNFTEADGLSNNFVQCLYEDKSGGLWIGTRFGGVSRMNQFAEMNSGDNLFTNLTTKEGLGNNFVWSILEDKKGNMWFATSGGGLNKYEPSSMLKACSMSPIKANSRSQGIEIFNASLSSDPSATRIKGCSPVDAYITGLSTIPYGQSFSVSPADYVVYKINDGLPSNFIQSIFEDREGNLWFGTASGVSRYDASGKGRSDGKVFVNYTNAEKGC